VYEEAVIASSLGGVEVAAIRLRNRSIWPAMIAHALNDFTQFASRESIFVSTEPPALLTIRHLALPLILCLYGLWLLRGERRQSMAQGA
jgi:membrane protease YdiL (CAAX protease family)